jgi:hypothetical protein
MRKLVSVLLVLVVLLAGFGIGQVQPVQDASAQVGSGIGNYDIAGPVIVHGSVTIADGGDLVLTDDVTIADSATIANDLTVTDDFITEDVYSTGFVAASRETTVTVTNGGTVTPLGAYVPLSAAGNVGTSGIAGCTAGDTYAKRVDFINMANVTITFTDTGTLKLSGNAALGQWDTLTLRCDVGSGNWVEMSQVDN